MRFALLGNHPDGVEMATALVATGRFPIAAYTALIADAVLAAWGRDALKRNDLEEILADPQVELVIVAGIEANRPAQLRRALQSERHVLVVHPPDRTPEIAYEAGMIQKDTGYVLLPLLPEALHPAVARLKAFVPVASATAYLLELARAAEDAAQPDPALARKPTFAGWDVLRALGGEIAEVSAFAVREEASASEPVLVSGRFERGGLFQMTFAPADDNSCRLTVRGGGARAELLFPQGWRGPAFLSYTDANGEPREESWEPWDPWSAVVAQLESRLRSSVKSPSPARGEGSLSAERRLSWEDEIRCLELDEAARRSVERRRSSTLEYQEASEEVGFKGTMTLVGCALLWGLLALLLALAVAAQGIKSRQPALAALLPEGVDAAMCVGLLFGVPLVVFLGLQLLRVFTRKDPK